MKGESYDSDDLECVNSDDGEKSACTERHMQYSVYEDDSDDDDRKERERKRERKLLAHHKNT